MSCVCSMEPAAPVAWQVSSVEATAASPSVCTAIAGHPRWPCPALVAGAVKAAAGGGLLSFLALLAVSYPALTV
jgi:hypothetical protein